MHGSLAVHDSMALVGVAFRQIRSIGRSGLLFDLEEEWVGPVGAAEAFKVDDIIAKAD